MKRLKYYVLTSKNVNFLKRHTSPDYSNIPAELLVVIINTMDKAYEEEASLYCQNAGIEYHITESNSTPGRGKNSLLEKFLESDNDYCVQIDGDDYLTPHGVYMYNNLARTDNPPDAVCLTHQVSMMYDPLDVKEYWLSTGVMPTKSEISIKPMRCFLTDYDDIIPRINYEHHGFTEEVRQHYIETIVGFYNAQRKYSEKSETHCRITWYSRKAAEHRFVEDLHIGEDTLHYFKLKNEHVAGRLMFMNNVESPPTYIYDQSDGGTVAKYSQNGKDISWVYEYMDRLRKYEDEGILHDNEVHSLPLLKIDYPTNYIPDDCNTTGNMIFDVKDSAGNKCKMEHPANATQESLLAKYQAMF